jgi:hypothetical protein
MSTTGTRKPKRAPIRAAIPPAKNRTELTLKAFIRAHLCPRAACELGIIAWEKDAGEAAVFKLDLPDGKGLIRLYIEGLKADSTARKAYSGYWISTNEENMCAAELTGPDGTKSKTWGRVDLTFVNQTFPSDWTAKTGDCLEDPDEVLVGKAPK